MKPLGHRAYGSIGHLPSSRLGPGDHHVHEGQAKICLEKARDKHDTIIVQEKLDGSCCAVAKVEGEVLALGRAGYLASTSPFEQHHYFADWVEANKVTFDRLLVDGERIVGEWLAQAHGTRYDPHSPRYRPFVPFDIMRQHERATCEEVEARLSEAFILPWRISEGPTSISSVLDYIENVGTHHAAEDAVEGAVWRVERKGKVDFLAKWVRHDKVDGCYLPEVTGDDPVWHWKVSTP